MSSDTTPQHKPARAPAGLGAGGRALWKAVAGSQELDGLQLVQLTEACRMKDRCDEMDRIIQGKGVLNLMRFRLDDVDFNDDGDKRILVTVKFDGIIDRANSTANSMKQLLAALRLTDPATGKRPQQRGPRGAQAPSQPGGAPKGGGKVSSIDRARERAERAQQTGS